jgi:peptidoglycan/LPS O-acetylase OafA/YrhL
MTEISDSGHRNNFGLLRLVFAMCVLVSHSIELVDGNRSREPMTCLFGTLSLGELGVDGFFLISGYLITQSLENSATLLSYLWKRILRIYPAFAVSFLFCMAVVGPLSGAKMEALGVTAWAKQLLHLAALQTPWLPEAFSELHYPLLNGSMWTIAYEFRCYLLIAVFGLIGLLRQKWLLLALLIGALLFEAFFRLGDHAPIADLIGLPKETIRLTVFFLAGAAFYGFRSAISYRSGIAVIAAIVLLLCLFNSVAATLALPTFGGYLVFWFAFLKGTAWLNNINNKTDISYGVYLYAWPVQNLLIKFVPGISPLTVMLATTIAVVTLGILSWRFIEEPCLRLKRSRSATISGSRTSIMDHSRVEAAVLPLRSE